MPAINEDAINDIFTYHRPTEDQIPRYEAIRKGAKEFAQVIIDNTLPSPDQSVAIRKLREVVHVANASIALRGRY